MTWQIFLYNQILVVTHILLTVNTWTGNVSDMIHCALTWEASWPGRRGRMRRNTGSPPNAWKKKIKNILILLIISSYLRMVSASLAISCSEAGGGRLGNWSHRPENSSLDSRGRDLVFTTFLGILLTLTSWLNLTWRDSDTLECSDLRLGDRFTWAGKSLRFSFIEQDVLWQRN